MSTCSYRFIRSPTNGQLATDSAGGGIRKLLLRKTVIACSIESATATPSREVGTGTGRTVLRMAGIDPSGEALRTMSVERILDLQTGMLRTKSVYAEMPVLFRSVCNAVVPADPGAQATESR
jgi:hypothetical protein